MHVNDKRVLLTLDEMNRMC